MVKDKVKGVAANLENEEKIITPVKRRASCEYARFPIRVIVLFSIFAASVIMFSFGEMTTACVAAIVSDMLRGL